MSGTKERTSMKLPSQLTNLFKTRNKEKPVSLVERGMLITILSIILVAVVAILIFDLVVDPTNRIVLMATGILLAAAWVLAFFNVFFPGRLLAPIAIFIAITFFILRGGIRDESIMAYAAVLVLAGLLLGKSGVLIFGVLTAVAAAVTGYLETTGRLVSNLEGVTAPDALTVAIILLAIALLVRLLITRLENALAASRVNERAQIQANQELTNLKDELEQHVARRTAQLNAVITVGRTANTSLDVNELMNRVVEVVSKSFGYYYAAIFLVDGTGTWAELKSATGAAGRVLLENKHRLEIGGKSMVGTAISTRKARVALDVGGEAVRFDNPLLPETRSEIALPLMAGERVLGALDVQATQEAAFGQQEIETLQSMADQVAAGLENARLYQETQRNLEEVNSVYRQYLSTRWRSVENINELEYSVGEAVPGGENNAINVPISLREHIIGKLVVEGETDLSAEERSIIEAVANQAALALENARLLEETQQLAVHERTAAEITGKIWAATTIDSILQTALKEISQALNAAEGSIELKVDNL